MQTWKEKQGAAAIQINSGNTSGVKQEETKKKSKGKTPIASKKKPLREFNIK